MEHTRPLEAFYKLERERLLAIEDGPAGMYGAPVFGEGPQEPFLLLIGEAPGGEEAKQGRPFLGKAGQQLDALLQLAGIPRERVYITNTVKYRPVAINSKGGMRNRTPGKREIQEGLPLLAKELFLTRPKVVATLGNVALNAALALCGAAGTTIGAVHGAPMRVQFGEMQIVLMGLYHPASTIYNKELLPVCKADIRRLGELYEMNKNGHVSLYTACEQMVSSHQNAYEEFLRML